jgi:membrane-bound metal-dependent hydrolase YbcI (DUF457 family)
VAELAFARRQVVIAGHFGFAAVVKSREPRTPLWALMLATVWLDIVFVPLLLAGIETLEPVAGTRGGYGANIIHADYTHSLLGAAVLSALLGFVAAARWSQRVSVVLGAVAFSHWLLDLPLHRADMPLLPGNAGNLPKLGLGLWRFPPVVIAIELALVAAGAWLYWGASRSLTSQSSQRRRAATVSLMILLGGAAVLTLDVAGILG